MYLKNNGLGFRTVIENRRFAYHFDLACVTFSNLKIKITLKISKKMLIYTINNL